MSTNNPPIEAHGHATFILTRATGEIEIRGTTPDHLWAHQLQHPDYKFGAHEDFGHFWSVKGMRA